MKERIKVFTLVSGHGETVAEPPDEDHINHGFQKSKVGWCMSANPKVSVREQDTM